MSPKLIRLLPPVTLGLWLALVQPGLSPYWLLDPHLHAQVDADRYGQEPDGEPLPGQPWHPPHDHPTSAGLPVSFVVLSNAFDAAFYHTVFAPARQLLLWGERLEVCLFAHSIVLPPLERPPCARLKSPGFV